MERGEVAAIEDKYWLALLNTNKSVVKQDA